MTTIYAPMIQDEMYTYESYEDGKRYEWTVYRYIKSDGDPHVNVDCVEVPDVGPLLFIPAGPDVDKIATHDMKQAAKLRPRKQREKPDLLAMYQKMQDTRRWELSTRSQFQVAKVDHG